MTTQPQCSATEPAQSGVPAACSRTGSYCPAQLLRDVSDLAPSLPDIAAIWLRRRLDPRLREEVMVAVANANRCRYCTFSHREMALSNGDDLHALGELEQVEHFDERIFAAVIWAQARAEARFGPVAPVYERELVARFSLRERRDIDTVARVMNVMSSCGHTADGLVKRLRGRPTRGSRLRDELVMALLYFPIAVPAYAYLAIRRGTPREFFRDFARFSQAFESRTPPRAG